MPLRRRRLVFALVAFVAWFGCVFGLWALKSIDDAVPVGIDYSISPPKAMSVTLKCNSLFAGAARDSSPLPILKPQPQNSPALAFQRTPCSLPHRQARLVFALDTLGFLAAAVLGVWLLRAPKDAGPPLALAGASVV